MSTPFKLFWTFIILTFLSGNFCSAGPILQFTNANDLVNPTPFFQYCLSERNVDDNKMLNSILTGNVALQTTEDEYLNEGLQKMDMWLLLEINNQTKEQLYLDIKYHTLEILDLYLYDTNNNLVEKQETGFLRNFSDREFKSNFFVMPLFNDKQNYNEVKKVIIKLSNDGSLFIPSQIGAIKNIYNQHYIHNTFTGIYFGFILVMVLYNLFLYFSLKDSLYLTYVAYAFAVFLMSTEIKGKIPEFIFRNAGQYMVYADIVHSFGAFFSVMFTRQLLKTKENLKFFDKLLLLGVLLSVVHFMLEVLNFQFLGEQLLMIFAGITSLILLLTGVAAVIKNIRFGRFYLLAWSMYLSGVIIFILSISGIIRTNIFTEYSIQIGSAIEVVLLSLILAYRINILKREKQDALTQNQELIKSQNYMLEKQVKERTFELSTLAYELKNTNDQLEEKSEALKLSNEKLNQFAYTVSHDLKAPVRNIGGFLQLLKKRYSENLDSEANEFVDFAITGANEMNFLISELLDFSRLQYDNQNVEEVNLQKAVEQIQFNLRDIINEQQGSLVFEDLPVIKTNKLLIIQLLQNLIQNGFKYSYTKPPVVKIEVEQQESHYLCTVSDNGIGIKAENIEEVFKIFWRAKTKTNSSGSGIGLHTCKRLVESFGGEIWVESEYGKGSDFKFTIPIKS